MRARPSRLVRLATPLVLLAALLCAACGSSEPATSETWTWVAIPGSACGNGSSTGLGVNLTGRSRDVVVYFQGGGACWDALTCLGGAASNVLTGYGPAQFAAEPTLAAPAFDRGSSGNPFKDASFVFVPYCTGDLQAGTSTNDYGGTVVHHAGGLNTGLFLERLVATFPGARRIYVTGSSAGGYAAQLNYSRFAAAFPLAELHALADSAQAVQPISPSYSALLDTWKAMLPAGCGCATDLTALPAWLASSYPAGRFALTAYMQDGTLSYFLGYDAAGMKAATQALLDNQYAPTANARWFAIDDTRHTMLGGLTTLSSNGVTLQAWLTGWYTGDPTWASVGP
jgi:hypothetical protein